MATLNTEQSIKKLQMLLDYENKIFGPNFHTESNEIKGWYRYNTFFCSAIIDEESNHPRSIVSVLITTKSSFEKLICNQIKEKDLVPWNPKSDSAPVYYFASLILKSPMHARPLYSSIIEDMAPLLSEVETLPKVAYSVACSRDGENYLEREGFTNVNVKYMNEYSIYRVFENSSCRGLFGSIFSKQKMLSTKLKEVYVA